MFLVHLQIFGAGYGKTDSYSLWLCSGYGVGLVTNRLRVQLPAVRSRVSSRIGDPL